MNIFYRRTLLKRRRRVAALRLMKASDHARILAQQGIYSLHALHQVASARQEYDELTKELNEDAT